MGAAASASTGVDAVSPIARSAEAAASVGMAERAVDARSVEATAVVGMAAAGVLVASIAARKLAKNVWWTYCVSRGYQKGGGTSSGEEGEQTGEARASERGNNGALEIGQCRQTSKCRGGGRGGGRV